MFELPEPPFEEVPPWDPEDCDLEDCGPQGLEGWPGPDDGVEFGELGGLPDPGVEAAGWDALVEFEDGLADRVDVLDAEATLAEAGCTRRSVQRAEVRQLELAAHWADQHQVLVRPSTVPGAERLVRLGGDGTPQIAEFAPAELGAVLAMSDHAASSLVADALDLRHRFPLLWASVQAGFGSVWIARRTAQEARGLSREAAARVDQRIAHLAGTLTWRRLKSIVAAAILAADPAKALDDAEQAAAQAGVFLDPEVQHGYQNIFIKARAGDVKAFNEAIAVIARALKVLGHPGTTQQRRADAVAIIADPHTAQDLIARAEQVRQTQREATAARRAGDTETAEQIASTLPGGADGSCRSGPQRPFRFGTSVLYVHLAHETLDAILAGQAHAGASVLRVEDIGPVIADQVREWVGHTNLTVKPVINLPGLQPVDHYHVSPAISEAIGLIRTADSWPYATCVSRHQDNEHTTPYIPMSRGGPPGQTNPQTMSKMTRRHHRTKTFGSWTIRQLRPGAWLNRSPHGYYFLVDQHGTTPLGKLGEV